MSRLHFNQVFALGLVKSEHLSPELIAQMEAADGNITTLQNKYEALNKFDGLTAEQVQQLSALAQAIKSTNAQQDNALAVLGKLADAASQGLIDEATARKQAVAALEKTIAAVSGSVNELAARVSDLAADLAATAKTAKEGLAIAKEGVAKADNAQAAAEAAQKTASAGEQAARTAQALAQENAKVIAGEIAKTDEGFSSLQAAIAAGISEAMRKRTLTEFDVRGDVDNENKVFNLPKELDLESTVWIMKNNLKLDVSEYSLDGNTLKLVAAPEAHKGYAERISVWGYLV